MFVKGDKMLETILKYKVLLVPILIIGTIVIGVIIFNDKLTNPIPISVSDKGCIPPIQVASADYKDNNIKYLSTQVNQLCRLMSKGE
jgi:hypothetical protein